LEDSVVKDLPLGR